jgi:lipopolysaccharide biosynthesis glycosyltransferase
VVSPRSFVEVDVDRQMAAIRRAATAGEWHAARVTAERLVRTAPDDPTGHLAAGWLSHRRGWFDKAWDHLSHLVSTQLARFVPVAAFESALLATTPNPDVAQSIVADADALRPMPAAHLSRRQLVRGELGSARALAERAARGPNADAANIAAGVLDACRRIDASSRAASGLPIAMTYPEPALALGPHEPETSLETLGLIAHVEHAAGAEFTPHTCLSRELIGLHPIPEGVWTVVTGGPYRPQFELGTPFPLRSPAHTLVVGLHLGSVRILTPQVADFLRQCAPVGCRDWATVALLLGAGIPAFYSDTLAWAAPASKRGHAAEWEPEPEQPLPPARLAGPDHLVHGVASARQFVTGCTPHSPRLTTADLAVAVAATAAGAPVDYRPAIPGASRADRTPIETGPRGEGADAPRLYEPLVGALSAIVDGKAPAQVRQVWRAAVVGDVDRAVARCRATALRPPSNTDLSQQVALIASRLDEHGPKDGATRVEVAMAFDENLRRQLPVAVHALQRHTARPVTLTLLTRGIGHDDILALTRSFPDLHLRVLPCDGVKYGHITRMIPHVTVSTMDRLLLPELLPDVDRVVYLDVDALVQSDVGILAAWDLGDAPLGARSAYALAAEALHRIAEPLAPALASELRARCCDLALGVRTFNAGVLVLDLERMRRDRFVAETMPLVARFGLHDQDALLLYCGGNRAELDAQWNAWPLIEPVAGPHIVHYLGPLKPWNGHPIPGDQWWTEADASYRDLQRRLG